MRIIDVTYVDGEMRLAQPEVILCDEALVGLDDGGPDSNIQHTAVLQQILVVLGADHRVDRRSCRVNIGKLTAFLMFESDVLKL